MSIEQRKISRRSLVLGGSLFTTALILGQPEPRSIHPSQTISTDVDTQRPDSVFQSPLQGATPFPPELEGSSSTESKPDEIDMLDFYVSESEKGLQGTHFLGNHVDYASNSFFIIKDQRGNRFEMYQWDDRFIRLVLDTDPQRTYGFTGGIFAARRMTVGERIVVSSNNEIVIYKNNIPCSVSSIQPYNYQIMLESYNSDFECGGDLRRQTVAVLKYTPHGGYPERFYLSKKWGLIRWEEWEKDEERIRASSFFNRIVDKNIKPDFKLICNPRVESPGRLK